MSLLVPSVVFAKRVYQLLGQIDSIYAAVVGKGLIKILLKRFKKKHV